YRLKASYIIAMCNDRALEWRFAERYEQRGWPKIEVIWDIPQTPENREEVECFVRDYCEGTELFKKVKRGEVVLSELFRKIKHGEVP
ncbi:MAG: hypothetical protein ABC596_09705, partial [Candidatus Methanosuratincola petrocarbonis]